MHFNDLYKSVIAVLRFDATGGRVVGTAFVINRNPLYLITSNHVVADASTNNDGAIKYAIAKSIDPFDDFDLQNVNVSSYQVSQIHVKPEFDLAVLKVNPGDYPQVAETLNLTTTPALPLSVDLADRIPGSRVEWLSPAAAGDHVLIPRFFRGHLITRYKRNQPYSYKNAAGEDVIKDMDGISLLEVDQLFIPGVRKKLSQCEANRNLTRC
jgi:hypothetical protein